MSDTPHEVLTPDAEYVYYRRLQAAEAELAAAQAKIDRMDCTYREGGDTLHCRVDAPCFACQLASAHKRIAELERGEYVCKKCGLRKDAEFERGEF